MNNFIIGDEEFNDELDSPQALYSVGAEPIDAKNGTGFMDVGRLGESHECKTNDDYCICETCDTDADEYHNYSCKTCKRTKGLLYGESVGCKFCDSKFSLLNMTPDGDISCPKCNKEFGKKEGFETLKEELEIAIRDLDVITNPDDYRDQEEYIETIQKEMANEKLNKDGTGVARAVRGINPNNYHHTKMMFDYVSKSDCKICKPYDGMIFDRNDEKRPIIPRLESGGWTARPFTHPNCYSNDTEVYTDQGWKLFKDLDKTEKVLSLNPDNEDLEWIKPIDYVSFKSEKMIHFKNKWNDILVTPEHNMVIRGWKGKIKLKPANECKTQVIPRSSKWIGNDVKTVKIDDLEIEVKTFCKFMGYYLSEGSVTHRHKNSEQIAIAQYKTGQLQTMFDDISSIPLKINMGKTQIYINNASFGLYLQQFGKSYQKFVPDIIKEMNSDLIKVFLDAYLFGDGHIRKVKSKFKGINFIREERMYFTSSKKMADDIGELILKIGKVPKFNLDKTKGKVCKFKNGEYVINHDMWRIRENNSTSSSMFRMNIATIDYNDMVYCVELPKFHTLYVRRNGQCSWSGNCHCKWIKVFNEVSTNHIMEATEIAPDLIARGKVYYGDGWDQLKLVEKQLVVINMLQASINESLVEEPVPIVGFEALKFKATEYAGDPMAKPHSYGIQKLLDNLVGSNLQESKKIEIEETTKNDFSLENLLALVAKALVDKLSKKLGVESKANEELIMRHRCNICKEEFITQDKVVDHKYEVHGILEAENIEHVQYNEAFEGGKGSGKNGHSPWMLGTYLAEECPNCMISTEREDGKCIICRN